MDAIYLVIGSESKGPFTWAQVQQMLARGDISRVTMAWYAGAPNWAPLGTLDGYGGLATPAGIAPPAQMPASVQAGAFSKPELRVIAKSQNLLMWAVAAGFFAFFIAKIPVLGLLMVVAIAVFQIYALWTLGRALRFSTFSLVLLCLTIFIPCVSLLVLVLVSGRASQVLKAAGIRVGFMGGRAEDIKD
jgi:hypothetical protein